MRTLEILARGNLCAPHPLNESLDMATVEPLTCRMIKLVGFATLRGSGM